MCATAVAGAAAVGNAVVGDVAAEFAAVEFDAAESDVVGGRVGRTQGRRACLLAQDRHWEGVPAGAG